MKKKKHSIDEAMEALSFPLLSWGVEVEEASKITTAWMGAATKHGKRKWSGLEDAPNAAPENILKLEAISNAYLDKKTRLSMGMNFSAEVLEEAIFAVYQDDIERMAAAVVACPTVEKRFNANPTAFWKRLVRYIEQKSAGHEWQQKQPEWLFFAFDNWIREPCRLAIRDLLSSQKSKATTKKGKCFMSLLNTRTPPMCLWADSTILRLFPDMPETDKNCIRTKLFRKALFRPNGFCFCFHDNEWKQVDRKH